MLRTFRSLNIAHDGIQYLKWPRKVISFDLDCSTDPSLFSISAV